MIRYRYAVDTFAVGSVKVRVPWTFGWSSGDRIGVPAVVHVVPLVERWTRNDVSLIELSLKVTWIRRLLPLPMMANVSPSALSGGSARITGRIMSISSWERMWQWYTYSQPKLASAFVIAAVGTPLTSTLLN